MPDFLSSLDLAAPLALLLLPLPFLFAWAMPPEREGSSGALRVPGSLVGEAATGAGLIARGRRRLILIGLLWAALVVALAGPRIVVAAKALPASGREIILTLDLSGSMERRDFSLDGQTVSRLQAVKQVGADFIRRRGGDRIGLVAFADQAFVAAAPTFDTASVARALEEATIGLVGRSTGIGDGLGLALKRLALKDGAGAQGDAEKGGPPPGKDKVVVLLSDGANNAGQTAPKEVAELAKELGVRIYTIALGPIDMADNPNNEQDVVDVETLREMATVSGGKAFRVKTTDDLVAVAGAIDELEGGRAQAPPVPLWRDLWPWPAALALLCACALLATRRDG